MKFILLISVFLELSGSVSFAVQHPGHMSTSLGSAPSPGGVPGDIGVLNAGSQSISDIFNSRPDMVIKRFETNQKYVSDLGSYTNQVSKKADSLSSQVQDLTLEATRLSKDIEKNTRQALSQKTTLNDDPRAVADLIRKAMAQAKAAVDLPSIPDPKESELGYEFRSTGKHRDEVSRLYKDLYKIKPIVLKQINAKDLGLMSTKEADQSYSLGNDRDGDFFTKLAKEFLDIAVGLDPVTGFGRSAYELFYGRNLITNAKLTDIERSFAFLGVATAGGSRFIGQAGKGVWKIYDGASHLLKERGAIKAAIMEGEKLLEHGGLALQDWSKKHKILSIQTAEHINQTKFAHYPNTPPFELGSHVVEFETLKASEWLRVHGPGNQEGHWIMRKSEIAGLTAEEIKVKYALKHTPTHISDVHVPEKTKLYRGNIQDHGLGGQGTVQYYLHSKEPEWFKNMRTL